MKGTIITLVMLISMSGVFLKVCDSKDALVSEQEIKAQSFEPRNDNPDVEIRNGQEGIYTITSGTIDAGSNSSCVRFRSRKSSARCQYLTPHQKNY